MTDYKFVCPEDIEECHRFCLYHARSFGRALPEEIWHYTDANGLTGILQTGKVWATQVSSLNDTLEQRYFGELVHQAVKERKKWNGGVAEDVEIAFGGASGLGDMTASGGEIKGH